jgi:hypothetical protein
MTIFSGTCWDLSRFAFGMPERKHNIVGENLLGGEGRVTRGGRKSAARIGWATETDSAERGLLQEGFDGFAETG